MADESTFCEEMGLIISRKRKRLKRARNALYMKENDTSIRVPSPEEADRMFLAMTGGDRND